MVVNAGLRDGVGVMGVVITQTRPHRNRPQNFGINFKDRLLVIGVGPVRVRVVAEQNDQVGAAGAGVLVVGIAHRALHVVLGAGIAEEPDARGLGRARFRRSREAVDRRAAGCVFGVALFRIGGGGERGRTDGIK